MKPSKNIKKLVILTSDGFEQRYVANQLCDNFDIEAVLVDIEKRQRTIQSYLEHGVINVLSKVGRQLFLRLIKNNQKRVLCLKSVLGDTSLNFSPSENVRYVQGINSRETHELLKTIKPDAMLVYGTTVVSEETLNFATELALNMHTGISPDYRGTACAFWPIVNQEPHKLGATIHECTALIDGGKVFARTHSQLEKGDSLHSIFAKAVVAGAQAYVNVVADVIKGPLKGVSQDLTKGREYRGHELVLWPEIKSRLYLWRFERQA